MEMPKIDVSGDDFRVDVAAGNICHIESGNIIKFSDMTRIPALVIPQPDKMPLAAYSVMRFLYDKELKCQFQMPAGTGALPENVALMEMLHASFLDPAAYAQKMGKNIPVLGRDNDSSELFHMAREIPRVKLFNNEFYFDILQGWLQRTNDADNKISFMDIEITDKGLIVPFDAKTGKIPVLGSESIDLVVLPPVKEIDPIGFKRVIGQPVGFFKNEEVVQRSAGKPFHVMIMGDNYGLGRGRSV